MKSNGGGGGGGGIIASFFSRSASMLSKSILEKKRKLELELEEILIPIKIANRLKARFSLTEDSVEKLQELTALREPAASFPFTRAMKRRLICHLGPTNSGKTYSAIEELKKVESGGVYCAPLRLLAQEMYDKLNGVGVSCALRTGEVTKMPKVKEKENTDSSSTDNTQQQVNVSESFDWNAAPIVACTVEMLNLRKMYKIAIIDEIQMLADPQRGWAFTQALLACNAERIYLCGEVAIKPLIEKIAKDMGESVEFVHFERLTPLMLVPPGPIKYEAGDCVVAFSRRSIFNLKTEIEERTKGKRVAVVYGALPAENRSLQASKFNEIGSGTDILVASDAIGMGLNLNIKRIIFDKLHKFNGTKMIPVPAQQIRQIAGRAGRFNTTHEVGLVTCANRFGDDFSILSAAINDPKPEPYTRAYVAPQFDQIDRIRTEFPDFDLADILDSFIAFTSLPGGHFCLSDMRSVRKLLELLRGIDLSALDLEDLFLFLSAPVKVELEEVVSTFLFYTNYFIKGIPCPVGVFVPTQLFNSDREKLLLEAESAHKSLEIYMWLNTRFPHHFPFRGEAESRTEDCCKIIEELLQGEEETTSENVNTGNQNHQNEIIKSKNNSNYHKNRNNKNKKKTSPWDKYFI